MARILVVENNQGAREASVTLLESHGHVVTAVTSAREAIDFLHYGRCDLIISGYRLRSMKDPPVMNGLQLWVAVKEGQRHTKTAFIIASGDDEAKRLCEEAGVPFFLKTSSGFIDLVNKTLGSK
jgi:CheY-like chemotaxis protein